MAELYEIGMQRWLIGLAFGRTDLAQGTPGGPRQHDHRQCANRADFRKHLYMARMRDEAATEIVAEFRELLLGLIVAEYPAKVAGSNAEGRIGLPHSKACFPQL